MADPLTRQRRFRKAKRELAVWQERRELASHVRGGPPGDPSFWQHFLSAVGGGGDLRQPYAEHPGIYRAVSVIVQDMGGVPWQLLTGTEQKSQPVLGGEWYDLLNDPHPEFDMAEVWDLTRLWRLTDGEAFWVLYGKDGRPVRPREMPAMIEPCRAVGWRELVNDANGMLVGWEYTPEGTSARMQLLTDQVVHFKLPHPYNRRRGLAPMSPLSRSIRTDEKARTWNEASLDNGAEPSLALEQQVTANGVTMPLDESQIKRLRQMMQDRHQGAANARRPIVLEGGLKVTPFGWTPKDMEYGEQRRWSRYEIASAYGVPLMLMGDMSEIHSKESARVQMRTYWQQTVLGHFADEVRVLDRQLFLGRGAAGNTPTEQRIWAEPDFSGVEYLREEDAVRRANAEADRRLGFPLNEINERHELGYEDQEGGDVGLVSGGLIPATAAAFDFTEEPDAPAPGDEPPPDDGEEPDVEGEEVADPEEDGRPAPATRTRRRLKIASLDEAERHVLWLQYIRGIQRPGEIRMRGKIVAWMKDVRREVLRFVEKDGRSARKLLQKDIEAWLDEYREKWGQALVRSTDPVTKWIAEQSLDRLADQLGSEPLNITSPAVVEHLDAMGARKVTMINGRIEGLLRRTLIEGVGSNESVAELTQRIKAVMNASASRALMIARTESGAASTGARFAAYGEQGVSRHSWLTSRDPDVREEHADFEAVGVVDVGHQYARNLRYPLDARCDNASLVVNCRCDDLPED